jgi:O-antigen/teichoic acid export membrane protein
MIARAPLQLFQAVSTSILPHLTSLHHSSEPGSEEEFRSSIRSVLMGILAFTGLTAIVVLVAGPQLMQLAFSDKFSYARPDLLLVTAGMGFYLAAVTFNQAALAQGQARRASIRWIACAVFFIVWTVLPMIQNVNHRVEIGFTLTALILMSSLYYIYQRPSGPEEGLPLEGTPDEISARLAGLEEVAP